MNTPEIALSLVLGLLGNEIFDLSPWAAHRLVRWSVRRRYTDPERAEIRSEELAALINERPGKLFKLLTACGFAGVAMCSVARRRLERTPRSDDRETRDPAEMSFREFEELIAEHMERSGYPSTQVVAELAMDRGYDVGVQTRDGRQFLVQCKHRASPLGVVDVRIFAGMLDSQQRGILVSSSRLTRAANEEAARAGLTVIDGDGLTRWLNDVARPRLPRKLRLPRWMHRRGR